MAALRQTNFLGGELDPRFWGRSDLPFFSRGARTLRNFFVSPQGAALTRPGTEHCGYTQGASPGSSVPRLIPFVFSDELSYVLEFGTNTLRVWKEGALLADIDGDAGADTLVSPYDGSQVWEIRFAQTGNILTLACPGLPVYELRRVAEDDWNFVNLFTDATAFSAPSPMWLDLTSPWAETTGPMFVGAPDEDGDPAYPEVPARPWTWWVSEVLQEKSTGWQMESLAVKVGMYFNGTDEGTKANINSDFHTLGPEKPVTIRRATTATPAGLPAGWTANTDFRVVAYKYYRGDGDMLGFVGTTKGRDFVDNGAAPDYSHQPVRGTNPFLVYNQAGVAVDTEHPRAVAFFQERRCFGGTELRPAALLASVTGDYFNFDRNVVHVPGEALEFELAARQWEEIRHLLPLSRLVALTNSTVRSIAGHQGSPLDFDSVDARVDLEVGSTRLRPLVVNGAGLFCRTKGIGVRSLQFDAGRDGFASEDVSGHAQHLFIGYTEELAGRPFAESVYVGKAIVDWAFQEDPWGVVWAVREDGQLLSLTYAPGQHAAWARHDTDGEVKAVCCVPEGEEDAVYLVVERRLPGDLTVTNRIERMTSRVRRGLVDDDACVDAALRWQGAPTSTLTGLEHLEGKEVYITCSGESVEVGKNATPLMGPFTVVGGEVELVDSAGNPVVPAATIPASGSALLGTYVAAQVVLYIGLLFTADFESVDVVSTDTRLKQKQVVRVGVEVDQSRGMWVGQDFDHQDEWQQREVADGYDPPSMATQVVRTPVRGTWGESARIAISQRLPLPLSILAVTREVELGG